VGLPGISECYSNSIAKLTKDGIIKKISDFPDIGLDFGTGPGEE
jgi:hypothetical protein